MLEDEYALTFHGKLEHRLEWLKTKTGISAFPSVRQTVGCPRFRNSIKGTFALLNGQAECYRQRR